MLSDECALKDIRKNHMMLKDNLKCYLKWKIRGW